MAVFHSLVSYIDREKGILYRKMKKITKCGDFIGVLCGKQQNIG